MLAAFVFAASVFQTPDLAQTTHLGAFTMDLPLIPTQKPDGSYAGNENGVDFSLRIAHSFYGGAAGLEKKATEEGARLKVMPGVKAYRGGSTLPIKLGTIPGWLLRMNFAMADGRETVVDDLVVAVDGSLYEFSLSVDRHDPAAVRWLSRSFASLALNLSPSSQVKLAGFDSSGLLWQTWSSSSVRLAVQLPHTPFVVGSVPVEGEVGHREGFYSDGTYDIRFSAIQLKEEPRESIAETLARDLRGFTTSDSPFKKPESGKSRVIDGAPASVADIMAGPRKVVLLDTIKDKVVYRFAFSAPAKDDDALRNLDRMIESIRLLPAPAKP